MASSSPSPHPAPDLNAQQRARMRKRQWIAFAASLVVAALVSLALWMPLQPADSPEETTTPRETITLDDLDSSATPPPANAP
jgi:negative regulator of sigma E activity